MARKKQKEAPIEVVVNFVGAASLQEAFVRAICRENKRTLSEAGLAKKDDFGYTRSRVYGSCPE